MQCSAVRVARFVRGRSLPICVAAPHTTRYTGRATPCEYSAEHSVSTRAGVAAWPAAAVLRPYTASSQAAALRSVLRRTPQPRDGDACTHTHTRTHDTCTHPHIHTHAHAHTSKSRRRAAAGPQLSRHGACCRWATAEPARCLLQPRRRPPASLPSGRGRWTAAALPARPAPFIAAEHSALHGEL